MKLLLANPRGFCAGVDRAIEIVERALEVFGAPIYVRHEVVHNFFVVENLKSKGAIFVDELSQVPDDNIVIFSAHGVSQAVRHEAEQRELRIFDATCPLVTKVHLEVAAHAKLGRDVILIGHAGHPEVEGTMGQYKSLKDHCAIHLVETVSDVNYLNPEQTDNIAYVTQTTLSMDDTVKIVAALTERFPKIVGPKKDDICYATQNRQDAVKELSQQCELLLVVGSPTSSNSNRLRELAVQCGITAYLIDRAPDIDQAWLNGISSVGVTAGASAPEKLVDEVIEHLKTLGVDEVEEHAGRVEKITFSLPKALQKISTS
ncbi:4-hydroxy-3-methylbut-2-enyl diphosphate reductase [hydrothermal vent metagenome]|uniref:4-hydroxy-3-methylbut-2-enyl diphosphate reductase n=1 Tax=hydrothermal vent metagenome TaxID=652676 RepID=A0A3B0YC21_9ZZZZ